MEAAAPTPLRTMLSSSDPGVTKSLLFKSGRGFLEWLSCGKREGGFPPLLDKDSVSDSSDKRFSSVVEDEPSGNYRNTSQSSVIDLTHNTHYLCTRFRIDGLKGMSRGVLRCEYREWGLFVKRIVMTAGVIQKCTFPCPDRINGRKGAPIRICSLVLTLAKVNRTDWCFPRCCWRDSV